MRLLLPLYVHIGRVRDSSTLSILSQMTISWYPYNLVFIQLSFLIGLCRRCEVPRLGRPLQGLMTLESSRMSSRLAASWLSTLSLRLIQCPSASSPMDGWGVGTPHPRKLFHHRRYDVAELSAYYTVSMCQLYLRKEAELGMQNHMSWVQVHLEAQVELLVEL